MKMRLSYILILLVALIVLFEGCELKTDPPTKVRSSVIGKDLIIDEVFSLAPDKYYAYSWIEIHNPSSRTISWFNQSFPITGHVAGLNGSFLRTENDGEPWWDTVVTSNSWYGIHFAYPDTGYLVGENGGLRIVRHLLDGTMEFLTPASVPPSVADKTIRSVSGPLISPTVYAVGDGGTILRSTNRGQAWTLPTNGSGTTKRLNGIYFESFTAVYAVGDSGLILKSPRTNVWEKKTVPDSALNKNLYGIYSQATTEIAVGDAGTILISRNGGDSWIPETTNVSSALRGVYYTRLTNRAWVVGDNGVILRSFDSLRTWVPQVSGVSNALYSVSFSDSVNGWTVGAGGTVLRTTNGGDTWVQQTSGTTADLRSVNLNPPAVRIRDRLVVEMHAKRKTFFFDPTAPIVDGVNPNFDFIVSADTGSVFYDPGLLLDLSPVFKAPKPVPPQGWVIINSDSLKFQDHSNVGPGNPQKVNFALAFTDTSLYRARPVLWDLLESGEVRLIRIFRKEIKGTGEVIGPQSTDVVDVVRWGGYRPDPAITPIELQFPNNVPAGFIPEWYSLSRYVDDLGGDVNEISTAASFYMSNQPIPGWYSQLGRK